MNNEIIIRELINSMSDVELKALRARIDAILTGDLKALNVNMEDINLYEEMRSYLETKGIEGKTDATIKHYSWQISSMINFINKPVTYIRTDDIKKYLSYNKKTKGISDLTLEHRRICINAFFKWLQKNGYISTNPCDLIETIKYEEKERQPMSKDEMTRIREACNTLRDKVLVEVLYSSGCRVSELVGIKLDDIDLDKGEVHLFGKGRKYRTSFLSSKAIIAIKEYLKNRKGNSKYLIVSERYPYEVITPRAVQKRVHELGVKANIKDNVFPHRFRHTVATDAFENGMPMAQVSKFLGHSDIKTTLVYAKIQKQALKEAHQKFIQ